MRHRQVRHFDFLGTGMLSSKYRMIAAGLSWFVICITTHILWADPMPEPPPLAPTDALAAIHVPDGYVVELVAAEPLTEDPVAIDWGLDGALWVAEMADYPSGIEGQGKPGGRIRVLRDTDGDGRYDKSTTFLEQLAFPNGVFTWGDGVLVTAAPEILYAVDTDGDDRADRRETLYAGFLEGNQQLRVNGLQWGLDNWIYCASGSHHSGYGADRQVTSRRNNTTLLLGSRDFRIRPEGGLIEPESGPSQFGRNQNDWGDWFGVQNSYPLWHYVLADRYIRRNSFYATADPRKQLVLPANPPVYPAKAPERRFHGPEMAGHFTSACSGMVYRDSLLFDDGAMHGFTCEPFHNLIQHHVLTRDGVSYAARRGESDKELDFFASRDHWCRPVMVRTGPDGALWVVDMYRYMIEHPEWLPPEGKDALRPFYRSGDTLGRIYRIYPKNRPPRNWQAITSTAKPIDFVRLLESENGWLRDKAQQTIVNKIGPLPDVIAELRAAVRVTPRPLTAMHSLCSLDGIDALDDITLQQALSHPHWAVRRQSLRIAEDLLPQRPWLARYLLEMIESDPAVQLQLACTLGEISNDTIASALARLAIANPDPFLRDAVMSSLRLEELNTFVSALQASPERLSDWIVPLGRIAAERNQEPALHALLRSLLVPPPNMSELAPWQLAGLGDLADATEQAGMSLDRWSSFQEQNSVSWERIVEHARADVFETQKSIAVRIASVRLLDRTGERTAVDRRSLADLLEPQTSVDLQLAVVAHLARRASSDYPDLVLAGWAQHSPAMRDAILRNLLIRTDWCRLLLEKIEMKSVPATDIPLAYRQLLVNSSDPSIAERAKNAFNSPISSARDELVRVYRQSVATGPEGDPMLGKQLFAKHCAACHRLEEQGNEIGPNLRAVTDRSRDGLLSSIFDPNRAVEPQYLSYAVALDDGSTRTGLITVETGTSITLKTSDGASIVLLRDAVEEVRGTGKSLMPEGFEQEISPENAKHLIAYITQATSEPLSK